MARLPKLPDPDNLFSVIDKVSSVIDKGLGFIDKVSDRLDEFGFTEEPLSPEASTEAPESQEEASLPATATETSAEETVAVEIAIACIPCAIGHFSTSSGLLKEAVRFKGEGMASNEILDRIAGTLEEQNALEREDLPPEKILRLPQWEKTIVEEALTQSRQLRHRLENIQTIEELEHAAADTKRYYIKLNRQWYKGRFEKLGAEKAEAIAQRVGEE